MAFFSKPCYSNARQNSILQNSILHFPTGMLRFLKTFGANTGGFSLKFGKMPHIFQRTQQCLQKVVAYMEEWCSLCKIILKVMFAWVFSFII
jgi:hypothetical protein